MPDPAKTTWWSRNWKWFIPVAALAAVVLFAGFIVGLASLLFGIMKSSDAYKEALSRAASSPAVIAALGAPIKAGWYVTGNISVNGASGNAELAIPISGPKGGATIYLEAHKSAGEWTFSTLAVALEDSGKRIDLLHEPSAQPSSPSAPNTAI